MGQNVDSSDQHVSHDHYHDIQDLCVLKNLWEKRDERL